MDIAHPSQPLRAVIRCKAKQQLISDPDNSWMPLNESLLQELAMTLFQSKRYHAKAQSCRSKPAAAAVEDEVAAELAASYKRIQQQQQDPLIQQLNSLL
jgi:hypothetical protein